MANLPYDITDNPTFCGVQMMIEIVRAVIRGERDLALCCSTTGIGKTFIVRQECRHLGIHDVPEGRPSNANALAKYLWLNREKPVLLLDEVDHLFRQEASANLLKVCNSKPRIVQHWTVEAARNEAYLDEGSSRYREYIPPTKFPLEDNARQIALSNRNYTDPEVIAELVQEHWHALVGRGLDPVWIPTEGNGGLDLFLHVHYMATEKGMLRALQFKYDDARAAIEFYVSNVHRLIDIHPRRLVMIAEKIRANPDPNKRERALSQMLRNTDQRPKLILPRTWVSMDRTPNLFWPKQPPPPKHLRRPTIAELWMRKPQPEPTEPLSDTVPAPSSIAAATPSMNPNVVQAVIPATEPIDPMIQSDPVAVPQEPAGRVIAFPVTWQPPRESIDPHAGFEELSEDKCLEYFGIPYTAPDHAVPRVLAVRSLLEGKVGTSDPDAWLKAGFVKSLNNTTLFHIAKISEAMDDAKAQVAQAEANGFKIAEPTEYGADDHGEAFDLMLKALGLQRERVVDSLKPLVDGGYLRIIGGMRLYHVDRMSALMAKGRAMLADPFDPHEPPSKSPKRPARATRTKKEPEQPATDRDAIVQDIAKVCHGRIKQAWILGSADSLKINGYNDRKYLFIGADWRPHSEFSEKLLLEMLGRTDGRILTREHTKVRRDEFNLAPVGWTITVGPEAKRQFVEACLAAKADRRQHVTLDLIEDKPLYVVGEDLAWVLRKPFSSISLCKEGCMRVVVPGVWGDYCIILRGFDPGQGSFR